MRSDYSRYINAFNPNYRTLPVTVVLPQWAKKKCLMLRITIQKGIHAVKLEAQR
jgi:hypothetical protein